MRMKIIQWKPKAKNQLLSEGQAAASLLWTSTGTSWHVTHILGFAVPRAAGGQTAAWRGVWMWRQTRSTAGSVGRHASILRSVARVNVWNWCPTRSTVDAATTTARKGVPVGMECVATHKKEIKPPSKQPKSNQLYARGSGYSTICLNY
jgi:hypothetical protein